MNYQLFEHKNEKDAVAQSSCDDDFAAENWAINWALTQGDETDYVVKRTDGGFAAKLLRTVAGQWYIMRQ